MTGPLNPDVMAMRAAAAGRVEAFGEIVERHQQPLLNFFLRMGAYTSTAEDLAQETFLRLYRWRERYEERAKFTTFLYTLARHVWTDHLRHGMRRIRTTGDEVAQATVAAAGDVAVEAELRLDLEQALARLSEKLRDVIVLSVYQGLAYKEVGEILGIPEGTVKSRVFLALKALRETLGNEA